MLPSADQEEILRRRTFAIISHPDAGKTTLTEKLLKNVYLFDVYEGKNLEAGKKSYALSFILQDAENTLKDTQIEAVMNKLKATFEEKFHATLR